MKHTNRIRLAGITALVGSILQGIAMLAQFNKLLSLQTFHLHATWDWIASRSYGWVEISPWLLFLISLLILHIFIVQQLKWSRWIGIVGITLSVLAILVSEVGIVLVVNPNCYPGILCGQPNSALFPILRDIGVGGTFLFSGSLLFYGIALARAKFFKGWIIASLLLGVLALYTSLVIVEAVEQIPGFFKVDPITITLGLIWAIVWLAIGTLLLVRATTYQRKLSIA